MILLGKLSHVKEPNQATVTDLLPTEEASKQECNENVTGLEPNNIPGLVFLSMLNLNSRLLFFFKDYLS